MSFGASVHQVNASNDATLLKLSLLPQNPGQAITDIFNVHRLLLDRGLTLGRPLVELSGHDLTSQR